MATTNLTINLGVATGKMAKGFATAKGQIQSFTASVKTSMLSGLAPFLTMLGGALSIRAFTNFISSAQKAIDKIAKLSVGLGYTTEQLSSYELAAKLSGMELDEFANITKRMIKSVADANNGLSTQVRAFRILGLDAQMMAGLSTDEKMKSIADAVQRLGWTTETAGAVMDIFGSRVGPKMADMLMQGSSGIEAMQQRGKELGGTISDIDAAKVEIANNAMTELMFWVDGIARSMAINLAPTVMAISDLLVGMGLDFTNSMDVGQQFANVISTGLRVVLNIADVLYRAFEALRGTVSAVLALLSKLLEQIVGVINYFYETEAGKSIQDGLNSFAESMKESAMKDFEDIGRGNFWGEDFAKYQEKATREMEREAKRIAKQREAFNAVATPDMQATTGKVPNVAAVQRNTIEAYKAIADANKNNPLVNITQQVANNTKRIVDAINRVDDFAFVAVEGT